MHLDAPANTFEAFGGVRYTGRANRLSISWTSYVMTASSAASAR